MSDNIAHFLIVPCDEDTVLQGGGLGVITAAVDSTQVEETRVWLQAKVDRVLKGLWRVHLVRWVTDLDEFVSEYIEPSEMSAEALQDLEEILGQRDEDDNDNPPTQGV